MEVLEHQFISGKTDPDVSLQQDAKQKSGTYVVRDSFFNLRFANHFVTADSFIKADPKQQ